MNTYQEQVQATDAQYDASREPQGPPPPPQPAARVPQAPVRGAYLDDPRRKSPVLALVLSLMPGLGQIYVGFYRVGFAHAIIVGSIIALLNSNIAHGGGEPFFGLFLAFFWLYNVVDAWRRAVFYNNALAGIGPATLPEDFSVEGGSGSLAGGIGLVVVGVVLLSHTLFAVSLEWLNAWWPMAFVLVGAWLVYPSIRGKR